MSYDTIKELSTVVKGKILYQVPLSRYTSLHVGGIADIMMYPANLTELQKVICLCRTENVPYFILGRGSNLVIRDGGIRGIVIKLSRSFKKIKIVKEFGNHVGLLVEAGVSLSRLLTYSVSRGLSGMEFTSGIPGSLGGALAMNAGAQGREMKDITEALTLLTPQAALREKKRAALRFDYRTLRLLRGTIIINASIRLKKHSTTALLKTIEKSTSWRRQRQPLNLPSAGSVFKNPPGKSAGQLVEQVGLKGLVVGKAQISEKHANFIVNRGGATASDVLSLMEIMQNRVYQETGIQLEKEVHVVGENG
jgi:UDP-N-acetylmuramate dehydrogenase